MRSLRAASKRLLQIIPTKVMWLPYLQIKSQRVQNAAKRCSERIPLTFEGGNWVISGKNILHTDFE